MNTEDIEATRSEFEARTCPRESAAAPGGRATAQPQEPQKKFLTSSAVTLLISFPLTLIFPLYLHVVAALLDRQAVD